MTMTTTTITATATTTKTTRKRTTTNMATPDKNDDGFLGVRELQLLFPPRVASGSEFDTPRARVT